MAITRQHCIALDDADELAALRGHFILPDDLIYLDGYDLTKVPLSERKTLLARTLTAELRSRGGFCASACVYALIGAKVRDVPPGARLARILRSSVSHVGRSK